MIGFVFAAFGIADLSLDRMVATKVLAERNTLDLAVTKVSSIYCVANVKSHITALYNRPATETGRSILIGLYFYNVLRTGRSAAGSVLLLSAVGPLDGSESEKSSEPGIKTTDSPYVVLGILIGLALAIASFVLLFRLAKRQTTQQKHQLMQKELTILYDHAPCGYHSIDSEGTLINMNLTLLRWLGYSREELVGKIKFAEILEGHKMGTVDELRRSKSGKLDVTLIRKSGERLPVILSLMPSEGLTSDPDKLFFSTIDNTRCHQALERVKTLDQELEAFSYSISHDLRAPLRSIDGYSRILQEDYSEKLDDEGRRVLSVVMNNAKRMGRLIDDLLDFGRLGRKVMQPINIDMTSMVEGIIQELKAQESPRDLRVHAEPLLPAYGDADMMRQVWFNILENAVKFTGKKDVARIDVRSYQYGDSEICYEVKDNGVGFDMQYAGKLFGVFQRLHKVQDFAGTGVGLAIVKRIISRHGGRVWAEASLNEGAIFYFTLPIEQ